MQAHPVSAMPSPLPVPDKPDQPPSRWFPEARFLIQCARASISEVARRRIREAAQAPMDWPRLLDLARYHGVGPLLCRTITAVCPDLAPKSSLVALRRATQAGMLLNRVFSQELVRLCRAFSENGVPVIPFKGAALAAMAYRDMSLRDFDDLDFIVSQARLSDAQHVLQSYGYRPLNPSRDEFQMSHFDEPYHLYLHENSRVLVDLQWVMAHELFSFRLDRADLWDRRIPVSIGGKQISTLAPEELLIILCVHGSKHAWERLKWVVDVAELLRVQQVNWKRVFAAADMWDCHRMLLLGLRLAHRLMDTPLPPNILRAVHSDVHIPPLADRMPKSLLTHSQDGIDEHDGPALYFSLKDNWLERWRYGMTLCREDHPVMHHLPPWFKWNRSLSTLARVVRPLRAWTVKIPLAKRLRRAVVRLTERPT